MGRGGGGGPPPGLVGKEIGLYYAKKSKGKKEEREKNSVSSAPDNHLIRGGPYYGWMMIDCHLLNCHF